MRRGETVPRVGRKSHCVYGQQDRPGLARLYVSQSYTRLLIIVAVHPIVGQTGS